MASFMGRNFNSLILIKSILKYLLSFFSSLFFHYEFAKGEEIDSSIIKDEKSKFHLNTTTKLLKYDAMSLEDALIKCVMVTPDEVIIRTLDPVFVGSRDALAKF
ncbi:hypothetical protein AHAS_Ahas19G0159400 [Arachis hypogaea]